MKGYLNGKPDYEGNVETFTFKDVDGIERKIPVANVSSYELRVHMSAEDLAEIIEGRVNSYDVDAVAKAITELFENGMHRTLQQSMFKALVLPIVQYMGTNARDGWFDRRNEMSSKMAEKMLDGYDKFVEENSGNSYIPMI